MLVGIVIGALPGLGPVMAVVLLLPISFSLGPVPAVLMLLSAFQGAAYGGSISAIILGIPGTAGAVATVIDGYPMAQKGEPGKALSYSLFASMVGGIFGGVVLMTLAEPLLDYAIKLGDPEFFLLCLVALIAVGLLSSKDKLKSAISGILGLMVGTIGIDALSGIHRATFGIPDLMDGVNLVAFFLGMFAISELGFMIESGLSSAKQLSSKKLNGRLSMKEILGVLKSTILGSTIGSIIGIIPGLGIGAAAWFSYSSARRFSKNTELFGKGSPEGIAAPESANNAVVGGSMVPLLLLGIPGAPATAVIMAAFIMHGIQPGPLVMRTQPELVYAIFYGFIFTSVALYLVGKTLTPLFSRALTVPNWILVPIILMLSLTGIYQSNYSFFDVWMATAVGVIFYFLRKLDYSMATFILSVILGPIVEESLRRSLVLSQGSYLTFVTRPTSRAIVILFLGTILFLLIHKVVTQRKRVRSSGDPS
jgi:putative tricarboxylic transport membrane protein